MTRHAKHHAALSPFRRGVAALGILLVLVLGILGVSPDLHETLCHHEDVASGCAHDHGHAQARHAHAAHGHCDHDAPRSPADDDHDDAGCVVTQFAHGHALALAAYEYLVALNLPVERLALAGEIFTLTSCAHRLPPGCGPPSVRAHVS